VLKHPTAAGRGAGELTYVIEPGDADASILAYRMASTEAGIAMPELGRALEHSEGVALISQWIAEMPKGVDETAKD
jgi:predicted transcriptional regulator